MRDVLADLVAIWRGGGTAGLATVVRTFRSAPRPAGASMLVALEGSVSGSVSGGCVEGAVFDIATTVAANGIPVLEQFGVSDESAFAVGLTCGGTLEVFVEAVSSSTFPELGFVAEAISADQPVAVATVIAHPNPARIGRHLILDRSGSTGSIGSARSDAAVTDDARGLLAAGGTAVLTYGPDGERLGDGMEIFVASYAPRPRMLVFGAIDFAAAVAEQGAFLGYRVTVCDARPLFATRQRFPSAAEVIVDWPHRYLAGELAAGAVDRHTVVCVLTHDPKFDVPVLDIALRQGFAFVGAMGSRATHEDRLARLSSAGLTAAQLAGLSSPIGLDLGARTPQETAVSIAAEIVARRWGGTGEPLAARRGRIHRDELGTE
ncbi:XdhC family protein [Rhodococcus sp. KRD197]|uniref:XdhC family protein n=1 Tax=Rhodococcus sp. KRD197 TaxID=2729731 RepID=UPI0019D317C8|nr:XdhC/CoxI family protein [Rhodococcus sp. KRD197]